MDRIELINMAKKASENAHVPYSNFTVGTLLISKGGKAYMGCNVENHGIMSICGERVAFTKAISEGEKEFKEIYVVGKHKDDKFFKETLPCGYCRQFMSEFCSKDFKVITYDEETNKINEYTLEELLPNSFDF